MLTWQEIQEKFKDEWVAMLEWEEDTHGDVIKGHIVYHNHNRDAFYDYLNAQLPKRNLAIRYTGNVKGPFFLDL